MVLGTGTAATDFRTEMDDVEGVDNVLGEAGEVDFEPEVVEEPASDEEGIGKFCPGILSLGLLGPRTLPSFAYSHVRFLRMQRLQEGCSPLHWKEAIRW